MHQTNQPGRGVVIGLASAVIFWVVMAITVISVNHLLAG